MKLTTHLSFIVLLTLIISSCSSNTDKEESTEESKTYQQIHEESIVIDGHNDFLFMAVDEIVDQYTGIEIIDYGADLTGITHLDLQRQREGGLDVQFFSVWCPGGQVNPFDMAIRQIDSLESIVNRNQEEMALVASSEEIQSAVKTGKAAAIIGVEGGHMIEDDLNKLDSLYQRGARYLTLTWNNSTNWATSSYDEQPDAQMDRKGLTGFGREVVGKMNDLGMLVDISHVGEQTFWDVMEVTTKPVIASHSSAYHICNTHRNLKDEQLKAIAENQGVVMVNFYPGYIDTLFWDKEIAFFEKHAVETDSLMEIFGDEWLVEYILYRKYEEEANEIRPSLSILIDHIDYIAKLIGVDYVGLGSDFDGITINPAQLDDASDFPLITKALLERGYTEAEVKKILGENFLRVLAANE